jgi:hypothetical protein
LDFDANINIEQTLSKIENLDEMVGNIKKDLETLEANISINTDLNIKDVRDMVQASLGDFTIKPKIDMSEVDALLKNALPITVKPINLEAAQSFENPEHESLKEYLVASTEILKDIQRTLASQINNDSAATTTTSTVSETDETKSVAKIDTVEPDVLSPDQINMEILKALNMMVSKQTEIATLIKMQNFLKNND